MQSICRLITFAAVSMSAGTVVIAAFSGSVAQAEETATKRMPRLVSAQAETIDNKDFSYVQNSSQSGERRIVGAIILRGDDTSTFYSHPWLTTDFAVKLSEEAFDGGFCADYSNGRGSFRQQALLKPTAASENLDLHVDPGASPELFAAGGSFLAYEAKSGSKGLLEACAAQAMEMSTSRGSRTKIFPARIETAATGKSVKARLLILQLNSGNGRVSAQIIDDEKQEVITEGNCTQSSITNSLFDRECRLALPIRATREIDVDVSVNTNAGRRVLKVSIPDNG